MSEHIQALRGYVAKFDAGSRADKTLAIPVRLAEMVAVLDEIDRLQRSATAWEADALRYHNDAEFWRSRATAQLVTSRGDTVSDDEGPIRLVSTPDYSS